MIELYVFHIILQKYTKNQNVCHQFVNIIQADFYKNL